MLREFLPVPETEPEAEFYVCLANNGLSAGGTDTGCLALADDLGFDPTLFADAYEKRIVAPGTEVC